MTTEDTLPGLKCRARVRHPGVSRNMRCSREATLDGYCAQHHPSAEEERRKAREHRMDRASQCSELRVEVGCLRRDAIIAARAVTKDRSDATLAALTAVIARLDETEDRLDRLIQEKPCGTTSIP